MFNANDDDDGYTSQESDDESTTSSGDNSLSHMRSKPRGMSKAALVRVLRATGNDGRCLITNYPPDETIDYCHLLRRSANDDELSKLELSWGLAHRTLNVDTRFNVVRLKTDIHWLLKNGRLVLVPEHDTVKQYENGAKPDFDACRASPSISQFSYRLLATQQLKNSPILRLGSSGEGPESDEMHRFPFSRLILRSHLHPCFAICHAGRFASKFHEFMTGNDGDLFLRLGAMLNIYKNWMKTVFGDDGNDYESNGEYDDNGTHMTSKRRRHLPNSGGNGSKTTRALSQYLALESPPLKDIKRQRIQEWISGVSEAG